MMTRFIPRLALLAFCVGATVLGSSQRADAAFSVTLSQTGYLPVTINDGGAGDLNPLAGSIIVSTDYGTFTDSSGSGVQLTITSNSPGSTLPAVGGSLRNIALTARNASGTAATLTIFTSSDGYTTPTGSTLGLRSTLASSDVGLIPGNLGPGEESSVTFTSTLISGASTSSPTSGVLKLTSLGSVSSTVAAVRLNPTYTLQNTVAVTLGGGGLVGLDATTRALVPEPGTLAMAFVSISMLGLGYQVRRRRAQA